MHSIFICTMDYPKFIVTNQKEDQRQNTETPQTMGGTSTNKASIMTAADKKLCEIFPNFRIKQG